MKLFTIIVLSITSFLISASEYGDVVEMKLNDNCSFDQITSIKDEFNEVLESKGWDYRAEI